MWHRGLSTMCRDELYHIIAEERGNPYAEVEFVGMENASMHICYELHHYLVFRNVM